MDTTSPLAPRRRLWPVFVAPALFFVVALAWSGFWFYAASQVDEKIDGWRAREAKSGRTYDCIDRKVGGFPFRLEVRCDGASISLVSQTPDQAASKTPMVAILRDILVVAQVYDPTRIIAEFTGPATVGERGADPSMVAKWRLGHASIVGLPTAPQRFSIEFEEPTLDRIVAGSPTPFLGAKHLEVHTRLLEGSFTDKPVVETAIQFNAGSIQGLHPIFAEPFDADIRAQLRGLKNFEPKPWPERFRDIQAADGRLDFTQTRLQRGDVIAVAAGSLALTPTGHLDGELTMTVVGMEKIVPLLGLDKLLAENPSQAEVDRVAPGVKVQDVNKVIGALDRIIPGLGNVARKNANAGVVAGINMLGQASTLEGKPARAFPLKFADGVVSIGPLKIAQTPALF